MPNEETEEIQINTKPEIEQPLQTYDQPVTEPELTIWDKLADHLMNYGVAYAFVMLGLTVTIGVIAWLN